MFLSRCTNDKINRLHEKALRIVYTVYELSIYNLVNEMIILVYTQNQGFWYPILIMRLKVRYLGAVLWNNPAREIRTSDGSQTAFLVYCAKIM